MKYTIDPAEDGVLLIGCTNHHYKVTVKKDLKLASFPLKFMEPRKPTKRQVKPRKSFPVGKTKGDNA